MTAPRRKGTQTLLSPGILQQMERFRQFQLERGYSQRNIQNQMDQIGALHRYLAWKKSSLAAVTPEELQGFFRFVSFMAEVLHGRQMAQSTFYAWRGAIRHYYKWLQAQESLSSEDPTQWPRRTAPRNPTQRPRPSFKAPHWIPRWVPPQELVEKFLLLPDEYTYSGMRDQAIFLLAATVGTTNSELATLTMDGFDTQERRIRVTHAWRSRKDQRWVPLEPHVLKALDRYLAYARPGWLRKSKSTRALFLVSTGDPITAYAISEIFGRYSQRLGGRRMTCKMLRNVAAMYQLQHCGRTVEEVAEILGYKTPKLAQTYKRAYTPPEERRGVDHLRYPAELGKLPAPSDEELAQLAQFQQDFIENRVGVQ